MSLAQYNGSNPGTYEDVYYAGTGTLTVGQVLCFADDATSNPISLPAGSLVVPPTSSVLPRDLLGRQVTDVGTTNNFLPAGVVSNLRNLPAGVGPGWVEIQKPIPGDITDVHILPANYTVSLNSSIIATGTGGSNDPIVISTAGTYSGSARVLAIAMQTPGTLTLARCRFI